jgi:hypothetical protein
MNKVINVEFHKVPVVSGVDELLRMDSAPLSSPGHYIDSL